jgi:hypothetical protein
MATSRRQVIICPVRGACYESLNFSVNLSSRSPIALSRQTAHYFGIGVVVRRGKGSGADPGLDCVSSHQLDVTLKGSQRAEIFGFRNTPTAGHHPGIVLAKLKGNAVPGVGHDRCSGRSVELLQVLVGKSERDAQAAGLAQSVAQVRWQNQIVLELVDSDEYRMAPFWVDSRATERCLPELGYHQST